MESSREGDDELAGLLDNAAAADGIGMEDFGRDDMVLVAQQLVRRLGVLRKLGALLRLQALQPLRPQALSN